MKPIEFKGQTAVITGAASGMGLCASRELAKLGAAVVMCDINVEPLERYAAEINAAGGTALRPGTSTWSGRPIPTDAPSWSSWMARLSFRLPRAVSSRS